MSCNYADAEIIAGGKEEPRSTTRGGEQLVKMENFRGHKKTVVGEGNYGI